MALEDTRADAGPDVDTSAESPDTTPPDEREPSPRSTGSGRRRVLVSVFLVVTVAAVLVQNMPDSVIKTGLMVPAQPYLNLTGLDQSWSIFSPNPRQQTVYVLARVERADGSVAVHPVPTGIGPSEYWGYRWQKYEESLSDPVQARALAAVCRVGGQPGPATGRETRRR